MTPAFLANTKVVVDRDDVDNPLGILIVQHRRDAVLVAMDDSGVLGTMSLRSRKVDIADRVYMGAEYIATLLEEGYERAIRGLWVWRMDAKGMRVNFDEPEHFDVPVEEIDLED